MHRRLAVFTLAFVALPAFAQQEEPPQTTPDGRPIQYDLRQEVEFDILEVDGEIVKPSITAFEERTSAQFGSLFNVRTNFDAELDASTSQVK